jgi:uncharacterized protein
VDVFAIPVEGKYVLYRPRRRLAFVGNQVMADLTLSLAGARTLPEGRETLSAASGGSQEAIDYLEAIGFLEPDPPQPQPRESVYYPTTAVLLLTNRCNLRCTYCYADGGEAPVQDLSLDVARPVIDEVSAHAQELGRSKFELTFHGGGEPVQSWDALQAAVAYARGKELPCHVSMVSNGVCSDQERHWLLENLNSLSISFDGQPATQDRQRPFASGQGSHRTVMRTISALDEAKFPYGIRMTATAPWQGQLAEDVRWICEETGCQAMQVEPAFNTTRGRHQGPLPEESQAFIEGFMEAFEIASDAGRRLTYSGARPWALTDVFCSAPYGALIVNPAGQLVACYEIADGNHPLSEMSVLGQVQDGQVVHDEAARRALWGYLEAKRARCEDCFCYWHCAGDCYTRAYSAAARNPEVRSPRCTMNKEITAQILLWYIMNSGGVWNGQGSHPQSSQLMRAF